MLFNFIDAMKKGMSGAELFNLVNQAALKASVDGSAAIDMAALEYSKDKITMGAERKSAVISPAEAKKTAYHEGDLSSVSYNCISSLICICVR